MTDSSITKTLEVLRDLHAVFEKHDIEINMYPDGEGYELWIEAGSFDFISRTDLRNVDQYVLERLINKLSLREKP